MALTNDFLALALDPTIAPTPEDVGSSPSPPAIRQHAHVLGTAAIGDPEPRRVVRFRTLTVGSGTYRFKEQWGAVPRQLHWYYWLPAGAALPMLNHANPKYAMAAALWRRMPLWCANLLGPQIVRHLP